MNKTLNEKTIPSYMIGTWAWGQGINGSKMIFGKTYSQEQLMETFRTAYAAGFTFWDTAEVYGMGNAEKLLGQCIAKNITNKEDILISTKHLPGKNFKKGAVTTAINRSLQRMGIDTIDLYWLHQPYALQENILEMIPSLKTGKIKQIGLSNCNIAQIKEAQRILEKNGLKLAAVQNHFSLLAMDRQNEVLAYCRKENVLFFGYMVLEQGALSGKYGVDNPFPRFSMRSLSFGKRKFRKIQKLLDYEKDLAQKYQIDVSQIPIAWAVSKQVIPIVGLTKPSQAKALSSGTQIKLTSGEIENLEFLSRESGVTCKGSWE